MSQVSHFQTAVGEWAAKTFPKATDDTILIHLLREVGEIRTAYGQNFNEELADAYMILLHLAHRHGVNLESEAWAKFAINQKRQWGESDAEGVVSHVRTV